MVYILYGIFFLSCLVLIAAVLLQPGKTDAGALFTSNVSSSAFSPRGTATVLSKVTIAAATTFMLSALFLAMPALTGNISVLSSNPDAPADTTSSTDANSNANTADATANTATPGDPNANTATPVDANANSAAPADNNLNAISNIKVILPANTKATTNSGSNSATLTLPANKAPANK